MSAPADTDFERSKLSLWAIAAICAVTLHIGAVGAAFYSAPAPDDDDGLGINAIEVGLDMTSPDVPQTDLPQGPDADASAASPAVQEQKAVQKETDLPKETPKESENPDKVVTENKSTKPEDETPEKTAVQQTASQESVASDASAQQKIEGLPEGPPPKPPDPGLAADKRKLSAEWGKQISAYLERNKRYPAERNMKAATVKVTFTIDRRGHVLAVSVAESSGDAAFDEAALAMVRRSDPLPPPPARIADDGLSYTVPVIFRVKGK